MKTQLGLDGRWEKKTSLVKGSKQAQKKCVASVHRIVRKQPGLTAAEDKGSWKSGRRVVRKQICTMTQIKTSLKIFEQRTTAVLIIAVFGRNQSGMDTQDRVKKGEPQVKRPTGGLNRNDRTGWWQ